ESMRWVPGGEFAMGSNDFYPEERPVRRVAVDGFWMDEQLVTAGEFRRFVRETGYTTVAERPLDPSDYPGADPQLLVPGALVFRKSTAPVDLRDYRNWWRYGAGGLVEAARRAGNDDQWAGSTPRRPGRLRGHGSVRRVGGKGAPDRGGVGARGPRRARGRRLRLGRRGALGRTSDGEHVAGRIP